jgi:hypothetical protein
MTVYVLQVNGVVQTELWDDADHLKLSIQDDHPGVKLTWKRQVRPSRWSTEVPTAAKPGKKVYLITKCDVYIPRPWE